ncbi:MAG: putative metal-binding motif-containing protein [Myxococcales bacterium]|nr:putative metal-binding motif-containing protein [Myxococcales bacterium]
MGPGEDCNDANRAINPDAVEICGNDIDENCDGRIARGDCDGDGYAACDGSNTGSCDCDDTDRYVFSDARELCNGRDDNCDGKIDETFNLEGSCTVGIGVCQASAKLVCSPDGYRTLCSGTPAPASPELCDARDNDCDAQVDEDDVCALPLIGIYFECAKPRATDDPTKFTDCQQLDMEGFELRKDGVVVLLSAPKGVLNYDPKAAPYCWHNEGTWQMKSANTLVARLPNPDTGAIEEHLLENVTRKADRLSFSMFDEETRMTRVQEHRLVSANNGGKCNFPTGCRPNPEVCNRQDDDCDGQADNGLTCTFCDADKVDNDKNGKVDEPGEPCAPPPCLRQRPGRQR